MSVLDGVWSLLFPSRCPVCAREQEEKGGWCAPCLGRTLAVHAIDLSPRSRLDGAWACSAYASAAGALIRKLKYRGKRSSLPHLDTLLRASEARLPGSVCAADIAVPIPLHEAKERERGYNQVDLIFRPWLAEKGLRVAPLLARVKETPPLHGHSARERAAALQSAFALSEDAESGAIRGKSILLLDDILTTGTTLEEAARCLRERGAREVLALVIASDHG